MMHPIVMRNGNRPSGLTVGTLGLGLPLWRGTVPSGVVSGSSVQVRCGIVSNSHGSVRVLNESTNAWSDYTSFSDSDSHLECGLITVDPGDVIAVHASGAERVWIPWCSAVAQSTPTLVPGHPGPAEAPSIIFGLTDLSFDFGETDQALTGEFTGTVPTPGFLIGWEYNDGTNGWLQLPGQFETGFTASHVPAPSEPSTVLWRMRVTNNFGFALSAVVTVIVTDAPARIVELSAPDGWLMGQPGELVATVTGTSPVALLWSWKKPGEGWVDQTWDSVFVGLREIDAPLGLNEFRLAVSNSTGGDTATLSANVSEPTGADVLSWAAGVFNVGDVVEPTPAPDTDPPVVTIDTVADGSGLITVSGTVADISGIAWMTLGFFENGASTGGAVVTITGNTWTSTWDSTLGGYSGTGFVARVTAQDNAGNQDSTDSNVFEITTVPPVGDTTPPTVTVDAVSSGPGPIVVTGTVSDASGLDFVNVNFHKDGTTQAGVPAVVTGSSFTASWDPTLGGHSGPTWYARVTAQDNAANQASVNSNTFSITTVDTTPPSLTLGAVSSGAGPFTFTGTVADAGGMGSVSVEVLSNTNAVLATLAATISGNTWSRSWGQASTTGAGFKTRVTATDAAGNSSAPVTSASFDAVPASVHVFDDGAVGVSGNAYARSQWIWDHDTAYFEPKHSLLNASPQRLVYVSPAGVGNGLTPGSPTTILKYLTKNGITPTPGDQVRVMAGTHITPTTAQVQANPIIGTAAAPIRFVRHDPFVEPVFSNPGLYDPCFGLSGSDYFGIHGIDLDANSTNQWGINFGRRWDNDTGWERCTFVDVWHCHMHHSTQTAVVVGGTQGAAAKQVIDRSQDFHFFGCEFDNSGTDVTKNFAELLYLGNGNTDGSHGGNGEADYVDRAVVEACTFHDGPSGEAVDFKFTQTGGVVAGCLFFGIRVESQAAITAQNSALTVKHVALYDIREKLPNSTNYDAHAVFCPNGLVEDVVCWDIGGGAVGYPAKLGSGTLTVNRVTAWNTRLDNSFHDTSLTHSATGSIHEDGTGVPTVVVTNCVTDDGALGSSNASAADFVGPVTGAAEAVSGEFGSGFELASGSSIPASAGAMGKA